MGFVSYCQVWTFRCGRSVFGFCTWKQLSNHVFLSLSSAWFYSTFIWLATWMMFPSSRSSKGFTYKLVLSFFFSLKCSSMRSSFIFLLHVSCFSAGRDFGALVCELILTGIHKAVRANALHIIDSGLIFRPVIFFLNFVLQWWCD